MIFKKFYQFLIEKSDPKDIEDAQSPRPKIDPSISTKCPKCGKTSAPCECYIDDYYDAKLGKATPRPNKVIKPKKKKENE